MSRSVKRRTGCEQCKRRKVRCDERQPSCSRCVARGETCTGNFAWDQWQVERPWLWIDGPPSSLSPLENDSLRHWYDYACLNMAIFRPPVNPLCHQITVWLGHSKALRHTLECVAEAHREHFVSARLFRALQIRGLAISSLQGEVCRLQSPAAKHHLLWRTVSLSSLILCISAGWLDPTGKDAGLDFLLGAQKVILDLTKSGARDQFTFYILGLFLYCSAFSSYLIPSHQQFEVPSCVAEAAQSPHYNSYIHPVGGISISIFPLITQVGRYYRLATERGASDASIHEALECQLQNWTPPKIIAYKTQLDELAQGYRIIGILMLYQAKSVDTELTEDERSMVTMLVLQVIATIRHLPANDPLLNWLGPFIVIAGSELPATCTEERDLVERAAVGLARWTRVPCYTKALELVRGVWQMRDSGTPISWLGLMLSRNILLTLS